MKRVVFVVLGCVCSVLAHGQCFSGELATELHWNMKQKVNWTNQLRLNLSIPLWNGAGSIEASTLHMLRTNETIIDDWQGFSNIEEENTAAAIAVLGYMHQWERAHLFFGVRNVNEDFFTSDVTSLFFNGSCGIFHDSGELSHCQLSAFGLDRVFRCEQRWFHVPKQPLQWRGLQRLEQARQSIFGASEERWHFQYVAT